MLLAFQVRYLLEGGLNGPLFRVFFSQWYLQLGGVSLQGVLITVSFLHFKQGGREGPQCLHN